MENALRHHISISFDRDPAKYKTLSEKLEAILAAHHEDWRTLTQQLQQLIDDAAAATSNASVHHGLDPQTEGSLFGVLMMRLATDAHDAEIAELSVDIVAQIKKDVAVQGYWDNAVAQETERRWIVQRLDNANLFPFADLDAISADCMGVARANRGAFGR
jgi:type I restriction enzyme, R subunit